jgi:endonuclease
VKTESFRAWLANRYGPASSATRLSSARKVEQTYGDLDESYELDKCASLLAALAYSLTDSKSNKPNPTNIVVDGNPYNVLNNCKTGVRTYIDFLENAGEVEVATDAVVELAGEVLRERRDGRKFELEAHLQESLRAEIDQLESGLTIIDRGSERSVASGSIDILAEDVSGALVVIELKRGEAKRDAIGQIVGYMGDLKLEEPNTIVRGVLVAAEFDKSCVSALAAVPNLQLRRYRFDFRFEDVC